jgi:hypothetical protein
VTASDRAIRAERRALRRAERDRKRAERAARRLRHERVVNGGPIVCGQREPTWADLKSLKFLHRCDCGRVFEDESVFEHECEFCVAGADGLTRGVGVAPPDAEGSIPSPGLHKSPTRRRVTGEEALALDEPHDEGSRAMRSAPSEAGQGMLF